MNVFYPTKKGKAGFYPASIKGEQASGNDFVAKTEENGKETLKT